MLTFETDSVSQTQRCVAWRSCRARQCGADEAARGLRDPDLDTDRVSDASAHTNKILKRVNRVMMRAALTVESEPRQLKGQRSSQVLP